MLFYLFVELTAYSKKSGELAKHAISKDTNLKLVTWTCKLYLLFIYYFYSKFSFRIFVSGQIVLKMDRVSSANIVSSSFFLYTIVFW